MQCNLAAIKNMLAPTQALSRIVRSKVSAFKIITVYITSLGSSIDLLPTFIDSSTFQFNILWIHCLVPDLLMRHIVWQWPHFAWASLFALAHFRITLSVHIHTYRPLPVVHWCRGSEVKVLGHNCQSKGWKKIIKGWARRLTRGHKMSPISSHLRCQSRYNHHNTGQVLMKSLERALLHYGIRLHKQNSQKHPIYWLTVILITTAYTLLGISWPRENVTGDYKSVLYCITLLCIATYCIALCHTVLHCAKLGFIMLNILQINLCKRL